MHLVLNSYGVTLQKSNGLFQVVTPEGKQTIPPEKVKSISIGQAARITSDAILLAIAHEVDILFTNNQGMPEGRVWSIRYGSVSTIRRAQVEFLYSGEAINWVKELLIDKISNQAALLMALSPQDAGHSISTKIRYALNAMEDHKNKILRLEGDSVADVSASLRGWEGASSKRYFELLSLLLPENWRFSGRSRMPAEDPFNACLNYAYGILYGKVEGALIKAGLDPYTGIFHRDDYNRPALVFDVIEKYRAWIDYVVMQLFLNDAFAPELFSCPEPATGFRLEPLAKRILIQSVNDYLSEIISLDGKDRSRMTHIEISAQSLATFFTQKSKES